MIKKFFFSIKNNFLNNIIEKNIFNKENTTLDLNNEKYLNAHNFNQEIEIFTNN